MCGALDKLIIMFMAAVICTLWIHMKHVLEKKYGVNESQESKRHLKTDTCYIV